MTSISRFKNATFAASAAVLCMRHEFTQAADTLMDGAASPKNPYRLAHRMVLMVTAVAAEESHIAAWGALSRVAKALPGINQAAIDNAKKQANHLLQNEIRAGNSAWDRFCMRAIFHKRERKHIANAIALAALVLIVNSEETKILLRAITEKNDAY